jgi:DNA-binding LytR/AlgR family response regulator
MITAIAIDDEPPALKVIESFCKQVENVDLQKTFTQPNEALKHLRKYPVDLLFLDIQMPSLSGLEFYKSLQQDTMVIFTTAHSQFAVEGFNLNAVDYLLKPFTFERFQQAITKATDFYNFNHQSDKTQEQYLFIRADYKLMKIKISDILYIEGLNDYIKIHVLNQKTVITRMTMKTIQEKLPSKEFIRVHRSFIVPFSKIESIRNKAIYMNGKEIPIGGIYEENLYKLFGNK